MQLDKSENMNILRACFAQSWSRIHIYSMKESGKRKERENEENKEEGRKRERGRVGRREDLGNWGTSHLNVMASDHHLMEFWYHLKDAAFDLIRTTFYAGKSTGLSLTQFRVLFLSKGALTSNPL